MLQRGVELLVAQGHSGDKASILMVGDRYDTDIRGGLAAGARCRRWMRARAGRIERRVARLKVVWTFVCARSTADGPRGTCDACEASRCTAHIAPPKSHRPYRTSRCTAHHGTARMAPPPWHRPHGNAPHTATARLRATSLSAGVRTCLVLTGCHSLEDAQHYPEVAHFTA
eukprot:1598494-Prymnesium_polylepis.1